jgi:hypothetical protein
VATLDLDRAAGELYALPPAEFTAARDLRVAQARAAGDRGLAAELRQLRRPTISAWAVNLLARHETESLGGLVELAGELRTAQVTLQGEALRTLMRRRQQVLAALVQDARRLAADFGHQLTDDAVLQVERTLTAALSDPAAARQVCSGRLVSSLEYAGFGELGAAKDGAARTGGAAPSGGAAAPAAAPKPDRPAPDPNAKVRAELAGAERDLERTAEALRQARQAQSEVDDRRHEVAARRDRLRRELAEADRELHTAERALQDADKATTRATREHTGARRRTDRLRAQLEG